MTGQHQHVVFVVAAAVTALAAAYDWRAGEIPNRLTIPALVSAPLLHLMRHVTARLPMEVALEEGAYSIGGAATCALVPLLLYKQGALGGGDVKLLAAVGALLQPMVGVEAQMYAFFAGAILAPAKLAYEGKLFSTLKNSLAIAANLFLPRDRQRSIESAALSWFRLGPAIFVGVALAAYLHW